MRSGSASPAPFASGAGKVLATPRSDDSILSRACPSRTVSVAV
jgi:hypothetical protein